MVRKTPIANKTEVSMQHPVNMSSSAVEYREAGTVFGQPCHNGSPEEPGIKLGNTKVMTESDEETKNLPQNFSSDNSEAPLKPDQQEKTTKDEKVTSAGRQECTEPSAAEHTSLIDTLPNNQEFDDETSNQRNRTLSDDSVNTKDEDLSFGDFGSTKPMNEGEDNTSSADAAIVTPRTVVPPPPPPPPGMGGVTRPPGAPGAPPRPKRKKYQPVMQTKRLNWNQVQTKKLEKDSFWVKVHEEDYEDESLFQGLMDNFGVQVKAKKESTSKKTKELKVLDPKAAQNLSILQRSIKVPYPEIKRRIVEVDEDNLSSSFLENLIRCMPEPEQMKKIEKLADQYSDLAESEQFVVTMCSIKNVLPRLKSMLFKMQFPDMVQDIKLSLVSATEACEEVKNSTKFSRLLAIILVMGNYLNAGSRNAQSVGFEISFLPKLSNTKSQDGKTTLVHFLANVVEDKYPDIVGFLDEFTHIDKAARVSEETIQKNLKEMDEKLKQLETDIKNISENQAEGDKFAEVMNSFIESAKDQFAVLQGMLKKMESLYKDLAKFYTFDVKKYTIEEFFQDIKTFKENFSTALKENAKIRETEEKIKRARDAKERAQKEKAAKMVHKKANVDMTMGRPRGCWG